MNETLKARVQAKLQERRKERLVPMRQPRYDELFFCGVAQMNAMDGDGLVDPDCLNRFYEKLDQRFLEILSASEFETWKNTRILNHMTGNLSVLKAFNEIYQEVIFPYSATPETYDYICFLFCVL